MTKTIKNIRMYFSGLITLEKLLSHKHFHTCVIILGINFTSPGPENVWKSSFPVENSSKVCVSSTELWQSERRKKVKSL